MGATVLHADALLPVNQAGIPVNIRNTNHPEDRGTMIVSELPKERELHTITGVAGRKGLSVIQVEKMMVSDGAGFTAVILDIFKSYLAYKLARLLFPLLTYAGILAGCCCILGHIFPVWMNFAGGKGLACIGGLILAYDWKLFLLLLAAEILLVLLFQYICIMSISVSVVFTAIYGIQTGDRIGTLFLAALIPIILYKHLPNIRRIITGQEARVSWLWNAEKEEARLKERFSDQEWKRIYRKANQK